MKPLLYLLCLFVFVQAADLNHGVQTHFGQFRRADMDSSSMIAMLDSVKAAGIDMIRDECYWSDVETDSGIYSFPEEIDRYVKAAHERGIQILLILNYNNPLYAPHAGSGISESFNRAAFTDYCKEAVDHFLPMGIRHYEIWNEPNIPIFWDPTPDAEDYTDLLKSVYPVIKAIDSSITVLACATSPAEGNPPPFIDWLSYINDVYTNGGGDFMDGVSFHLYRFGNGPESWLDNDIGNLQKIVGTEKSLWITEIGYPTSNVWPAVPLEDQANYLVRLMLLGHTIEQLKMITYYDLKNDGQDINENEHNFGLLNFDLTAKPAFRGYKFLSNTIRDYALVSTQNTDQYRDFYFAKEADTLVVTWKEEGSGEHDIEVSSKRNLIADRDGNALYYTCHRDDALSLAVSERPKYIMPVTAYPAIHSINFAFDADTLVAGQVLELELEVITEDGLKIIAENGGCFTWKVSDSGLATIDSNGWISTYAPGELEIEITFEGATFEETMTILAGYDQLEIENFDTQNHFTSSYDNLLPETNIAIIDSAFTSPGKALAIDYSIQFIGSRSHRLTFDCDYLLYGVPDSVMIDVYNNGNPHYTRFEVIGRDGLSRFFQSSRLPEESGWHTLSVPVTDLTAQDDFPYRLKSFSVYIVESDGERDSLYSGTIILDNLRIKGGGPTGIVINEVQTADGFILHQNYPNPFNPVTKIRYTVETHHNASLLYINLSVYNLLGQKVATLVDEKQPPGSYEVTWYADDLASGVYFGVLRCGKRHKAMRMVLLR